MNIKKIHCALCSVLCGVTCKFTMQMIEHVINGVFEWYRYSSQNVDTYISSSLSDSFFFRFAFSRPVNQSGFFIQ